MTPNCTDDCARMQERGVHTCSGDCLCHPPKTSITTRVDGSPPFPLSPHALAKFQADAEKIGKQFKAGLMTSEEYYEELLIALVECSQASELHWRMTPDGIAYTREQTVAELIGELTTTTTTTKEN